VREASYHIATGFVGTPVILDALVEAGYLDAAERLLTQPECPSWLYPVTMGATTVWERWDSMLEDGSINPGEMTSFNHYALGAVADWLHRRVGGLAPAAPGYREVQIAPLCLPSFAYASATLDSPYGRISVAWRRDRGEIVVTATLPANTRAAVTLPGSGAAFDVGSGAFEWRVPAPLADPECPIATLQSTLAEVVDSPTSYRAVMSALADIEGSLAARLRQFSWDSQRRLGDALKELGPRLDGPVERALAELRERATQ
jgi:alpha-L-rhamnosidase